MKSLTFLPFYHTSSLQIQKTGFSDNVARFPEKSNVCPSDNEPKVRSEKVFICPTKPISKR
jgi:hypothetical protein